MGQLLPKGWKLHMTPRPEDLPVRAHPKVPKQGSTTDLEIVVKSNRVLIKRQFYGDDAGPRSSH